MNSEKTNAQFCLGSIFANLCCIVSDRFFWLRNMFLEENYTSLRKSIIRIWVGWPHCTQSKLWPCLSVRACSFLFTFSCPSRASLASKKGPQILLEWPTRFWVSFRYCVVFLFLIPQLMPWLWCPESLCLTHGLDKHSVQLVFVTFPIKDNLDLYETILARFWINFAQWCCCGYAAHTNYSQTLTNGPNLISNKTKQTKTFYRERN